MLGIITFHDNHNFGAALQCASLVSVIRGLGHEVKVVDYSYFTQKRSLLKYWGIRNYGIANALKKKVNDWTFGSATISNFRNFRTKFWEQSMPCKSPEDVNLLVQGFSHVIVGSDQVWRFDRPGPYFLNFGLGYTGIKVSYAACCTSRDQPQYQLDAIRDWINDIDHVSVRNSFSQEVVEEVTGRKAVEVCDPTLLVDLDIAGTPSERLPQKYILAYVLGLSSSKEIPEMIRRAKANFGNLPVVAIRLTIDHYQEYPWADQVIDGFGPIEWNAAIKNATFFITDSFHGILFSIKNSTPYFGFYKDKLRAPRLIDLKDRYRLGNRITNSSEKFKDEFFQAGPNDRDNLYIVRHREASLSFLEKSLR